VLVRRGCTVEAKCAPIMELLKRPGLFAEDKFYREYFAPTDARVEREYLDRWRYHEAQSHYNGPAQNHAFLSLGSRDYFGNGPYEGDVRHDFAQQVLRLRAEAAMRVYFAPKERAGGLKSAQATLSRAKENPIRVSSSDPKAGEFRVGYDVFTGYSKLEYASPRVLAGLYTSRLVGALGTADYLNFRVTASLGDGMPVCSLAYPLNGSAVEASLSKSFSAEVATELVTRHPLRDQSIPSYGELRIVYRF
jgi:hypothetical protein